MLELLLCLCEFFYISFLCIIGFFIVNYKSIIMISSFFIIDFIIWNITKKSLYQAIKKAIKKAVKFIIYG